MKNIKDIILSIFAVIGFVALLSSFTNQPQSEVTNGTPESHVFDITDSIKDGALLFNKQTGEVWEVGTNTEKLIRLEKVDKK
jgi:hypothetical protein